jgi:hypothetical protein
MPKSIHPKSAKMNMAELPTTTIAQVMSYLTCTDGVYASRSCAATKEAHEALLGDATSLVLKHAPTDSADELCLQFVSRSPRLRRLQLTGMSVRPETFVSIAQACPELETLTLDCYSFGDAHLLACAANFNNLRTLTMHEVTANCDAMASVASTAAWLPKLERVHFSSFGMDPSNGFYLEEWEDDHDGAFEDLFKNKPGVVFSFQPCPNMTIHHQCNDCKGYLLWNDPPSHLVRSDCDEHGQPVRKWCVCHDSCRSCTKRYKTNNDGMEAWDEAGNPLSPDLICDCSSCPIYEFKFKCV